MYIYCMYTIGGRGPLAASVRGWGCLFFPSFSRPPSLLLQERGAGGHQACDQSNFTVGEEKKNNNNLGVFTENGVGKKNKYRCKCQTNKLNAQLGHFTVFFSPFIFFHNQRRFFFIFFFFFPLGGEAYSPLALCVYFNDARRTFCFFFRFIFETTSGCCGGGTLFSWESPELFRAIFLFQSSPGASRLEGCFTSNAQLTRLRTVVGCSHFSLFIYISHLLTRESAVLPSRSMHLACSSSVRREGTPRFFSFLSRLLIILRGSSVVWCRRSRNFY